VKETFICADFIHLSTNEVYCYCRGAKKGARYGVPFDTTQSARHEEVQNECAGMRQVTSPFRHSLAVKKSHFV
jgi:hypothetical protein